MALNFTAIPYDNPLRSKNSLILVVVLDKWDLAAGPKVAEKFPSPHCNTSAVMRRASFLNSGTLTKAIFRCAQVLELVGIDLLSNSSLTAQRTNAVDLRSLSLIEGT